jgi:hypothetical protein
MIDICSSIGRGRGLGKCRRRNGQQQYERKQGWQAAEHAEG